MNNLNRLLLWFNHFLKVKTLERPNVDAKKYFWLKLFKSKQLSPPKTKCMGAQVQPTYIVEFLKLLKHNKGYEKRRCFNITLCTAERRLESSQIWSFRRRKLRGVSERRWMWPSHTIGHSVLVGQHIITPTQWLNTILWGVYSLLCTLTFENT